MAQHVEHGKVFEFVRFFERADHDSRYVGQVRPLMANAGLTRIGDLGDEFPRRHEPLGESIVGCIRPEEVPGAHNEALVTQRIGTVTVGLYAHRDYLDRAGRPRSLDGLQKHSLIGFDRDTPAIRSMRQRVEGFEQIRFALRTDSDIAQLMTIRAGFGIGFCQVALARRDPNLERVLPGAFQLKLGVWLAMHENFRSAPRYRAVFDALATGLKSHVD